MGKSPFFSKKLKRYPEALPLMNGGLKNSNKVEMNSEASLNCTIFHIFKAQYEAVVKVNSCLIFNRMGAHERSSKFHPLCTMKKGSAFMNVPSLA